ncbi:MAG: alpha-amylase family glycosyl hydrolase [Spirochaetes bacterium]|nr:alpha-amylase family glycosyl hydrolase [Spirochaetota bacterium]
MNLKILELLQFLYGPEVGKDTYRKLEERVRAWQRGSEKRKRNAKLHLDTGGAEEADSKEHRGFSLSERDSFVITYGDQFQKPGTKPLQLLREFSRIFLEGTVTGIHLLPFSPFSSDDGFSVIDYRQVKPDWGSWEDIQALSESFLVMADLVLNHCSVKSPWFQGFLEGRDPYTRFFLSLSPAVDVSGVFRPRTHPLLTRFPTNQGDRWVWTTFSEDQVDLNYGEPEVLLEMIDILLLYLRMGVQILRLDAIAYIWKELGTPCIHHPKTHAVVKLLRALVDEVAPGTLLITETNMPQQENLSYFGEGDEAHLVYQFALPALLLDAFLRADSRHLQEWVSTIKPPGDGMTFLNIAASHDGIGVLPVQGILTEDELSGMIRAVQGRGGYVSYKATPNGEVPYELNINFFSGIAEPTLSESLRVKKFLASQSILLVLPGVPGIYIHSLLGSENDRKGAEESGIKRRINREKLSYDRVQDELSTRGTVREQVFSGFEELLRARVQEPAFHPMAEARVLPTPKEVFALLRLRRPQEGNRGVLCVCNLYHKPAEASFNAADLRLGEERYFTDLITGDVFYPTWETYSRFSLQLEPFEVLWLAYQRR